MVESVYSVIQNHKVGDYAVYRMEGSTIAAAAAAEKEASGGITEFVNEPIVRITEEIMPPTAESSFIAVPLSGKFYIVGGDLINEDSHSKGVYSIEASSLRITKEPDLVSPKITPVLFCVGSRIYALAKSIINDPNNYGRLRRPPYFETLDTSYPGCAWEPLPDPVFPYPSGRHTIQAWTVCGSTLLITDLYDTDEPATYGFDCNAHSYGWRRVCSQALPFYGCVEPINELYYAPILSSFDYSVYRLIIESDDGSLSILHLSRISVPIPSYDFHGNNPSLLPFGDSDGNRLFVVQPIFRYQYDHHPQCRCGFSGEPYVCSRYEDLPSVSFPYEHLPPICDTLIHVTVVEFRYPELILGNIGWPKLFKISRMYDPEPLAVFSM